MCVTTHGAQPLKSAGFRTARGEKPGTVWAGIGVKTFECRPPQRISGLKIRLGTDLKQTSM